MNVVDGGGVNLITVCRFADGNVRVSSDKVVVNGEALGDEGTEDRVFPVGAGFVCCNLRNVEVLVCVGSKSGDTVDVMRVW